jgi:hypothetical protein
MVQTIRLGRGALMRVRKSLKMELVGCWVRRVDFFLTKPETYGCRMVATLWVRQRVGKLGVSWSFSLGCFSWKHPTELASDVHRPCTLPMLC